MSALPWLGQPRQIVSRRREGEGPSDALPPPELGFLLSGDCLDPPEGFFDPLADALTDRVAGVSRRAAVNRRRAPAGVGSRSSRESLSHPLSRICNGCSPPRFA